MAIVTGLLSCTHNNSAIVPVSQNQNSLALVVPSANNNTSNNILLLKDGRSANPVSGISNFNNMNVGDKLYLTFTAGTIQNGVVDIEVTRYASAEDSVFIPAPSTTSDTTTFSGTFTGTVVKSSLPDSTTSSQKGATSISFNGSHYTCSGAASGYPLAGAGTFVASGTSLTFTDDNTNSDSVLNGAFFYTLSQSNLHILAVRDNVFYSYSLTRK